MPPPQPTSPFVICLITSTLNKHTPLIILNKHTPLINSACKGLPRKWIVAFAVSGVVMLMILIFDCVLYQQKTGSLYRITHCCKKYKQKTEERDICLRKYFCSCYNLDSLLYFVFLPRNTAASSSMRELDC